MKDTASTVHFSLDGSRARTLAELWAEVQRAFGLSAEFGRNRDAFVDVLRDLGCDQDITHLSVQHCGALLRSSVVDQRFFYTAIGQVVAERSGLSHGRLIVHLS